MACKIGPPELLVIKRPERIRIEVVACPTTATAAAATTTTTLFVHIPIAIFQRTNQFSCQCIFHLNTKIISHEYLFDEKYILNLTHHS